LATVLTLRNCLRELGMNINRSAADEELDRHSDG
jgi:hypothetical protein